MVIFRNWVVGAWIGAAQLGRRGWQLRLLADASRDLDLDRQLTLGADVGLRGWNPDYFDGTGRALANVQWRALIKDDVFHVLALGFEVFVDAGATWDPRVGRTTDGVRVDAGIWHHRRPDHDRRRQHRAGSRSDGRTTAPARP